MVIEEVIEKLINQGFAVFVGAYVLVRLERKLDEGFKRVVDAINGKN